MIITIKHTERVPAHDDLIMKAISMAAKREPTAAHDGLVLTIAPNGEHYIPQADFNAMLALPCTVDAAVCFVEVAIATLSEPVPESFPYSSITDSTDLENHVTRQKTWLEYRQGTNVEGYGQDISNDGTKVMVKCGCCYQNNNKTGEALTNDELILWHEHFGSILCKNTWMAKMQTDEYLVPVPQP